MATAKKDTTAAKPDLVRIQVKMGVKPSARQRSKIFTSKGLAVNGSVIELPAAEARQYVDKGLARLSADPIKTIEPITDVERGALTAAHL